MAKQITPETPVKRRRREMAIGALLRTHMEQGAADAGLTGRLATQWAAICPMLAPYCWPLKAQRGVLTVAVASDPVRQELHYMAPTVIEAVNMVAGYEAVKTLRYEVRRTGTALKLVPKAPVARPESIDMAKAACQGVADAELQAALARLGAWLLHPAKKNG